MIPLLTLTGPIAAPPPYLFHQPSAPPTHTHLNPLSHVKKYIVPGALTQIYNMEHMGQGVSL